MNKSTLNILTKIKIYGLRYCLHNNNANIGYIFQLIFLFLFFVLTILVPNDMAFLLLVFPILNCCTALIIKYTGQKIDKEFDYFEDYMEFLITDKIKCELFEEFIKDLDIKKYHICRELDADGYIKNWTIFRKDMPIDEYFSAENQALLTSERNSILDLKKFIREQKNA